MQWLKTFTLHTLFPKNLLNNVLKHKQQRNKIKEELECKKYWHQPRKAGQLFQEEISLDERKGKRDRLERKESKGKSVHSWLEYRIENTVYDTFK